MKISPMKSRFINSGNLGSGGGLLGFALSAFQSTFLSFHVAHNVGRRELAVFSFLLSVLYFSVHLLRRNIIEPHFFQISISLIREKTAAIGRLLFIILILYVAAACITRMFMLSLSILTANFVSLFWEIRKAELRKRGKYLRYTVLDSISAGILLLVIFGNSVRLELSPVKAVFLWAFLQLCSLYGTQSLRGLNAINNAKSTGVKNIPTHSYGEYLFICTLLISNLYFMQIGHSEALGEVRAIFLFLPGATFSLNALRNSLVFHWTFNTINIVLLSIFFLNIVVLYILPISILRTVIPSVPLNFRYVLIPIVLDLFSSLLFMLTSIFLLRRKNLLVVSISRILSVTVLFSCLIMFDRAKFDGLHIAWAYAFSSFIGSLFLSIYVGVKHFRSNLDLHDMESDLDN